MTGISDSVIRMTVAAAMLAATTTAAMAKAPSDVADLVGARGSSGEDQLRSRGYSFHHASQGDDRSWTYWWNSSNRQCLAVVTSDGRYSSISSAPASDCGHSGGGDAGAAVAVGAAALIGALALSHKSHHHENANHYDNQQSEADYERGYRDGLYNQAYHNYDRSDAYSNGYSAGVTQRNHETAYRPSYGYGGYGGYVNTSDLMGLTNTVADSRLRERGFAYLGKEGGGGDGHDRLYWRAASEQCISVRTRAGQVFDIQSIRKRNCR